MAIRKDDLTFNRMGDLIVASGASAFAEAVNRGRVFAVANQLGITTQAGLSLTTPALTLANPASSGVRCKLWYASVCFTLAFVTTGATVVLAAGTNTVLAAVTGTLTTAHRNLKLGGAGPSVVPLLAATLPAAPVAISILGAGLTGAITTAPIGMPLKRWYNGSVLVMPGTNISIQTITTASGASATFCEYIWEEEDI